MADFEVTTESLDAVAARLRTESGVIKAALDELDQKVKTLEHDWDGAARDAYAKAHAQWTAKFSEMNTILNGIADTTEKVAAHYANAGSAAARKLHGRS